MARVFISGSADGLGKLAAEALIAQGHRVVLHARNKQRAADATRILPGAEAVLTADLSNLEETKQLAADLNASGSFDAIIHNAGVYQVSAKEILAVNTIAPYVLTCLTNKPKRLIYLSSGMHLSGDPALKALRSDAPVANYSDSKLHNLLLAKAVARKWTDVYANAVDPGWIATKMGGKGAPDDLTKGFETQVWLAVSNDPKALVSGNYFHHQLPAKYLRQGDEVELQEKFLQQCERISGVGLG
jgi:NAD(P)-dependent dehydrogenase (short-subunit alcohol dehydrogenase family)